jgi:hypothetical protein
MLNPFVVQIMLLVSLNGNDDRFRHFVGNDFADKRFAFITHRFAHIEGLLSRFSLANNAELSFPQNRLRARNALANFANLGRIIQLAGSQLKAEIEQLFLERVDFLFDFGSG